MMLDTDTVPAPLYQQLRDERDELAERLRQLEEPDPVSRYNAALLTFMQIYRLTKTEAHIVWRLMRASAPLFYEIFDEDWPSGKEVQPGTLGVFVYKIRAKLAPHGLQILSRRSMGYYADAATKAALAQAAKRGGVS